MQVNTTQFDVPWCYTSNVSVTRTNADARIILDLHGINYKADVLINDNLVRSHEQVVGTFRRFLVDVTDALPWDQQHGEQSAHAALTLRVYRPQDRSLPPSNKDTDLAISFVDWAPRPPDSPCCFHTLPSGVMVDSLGAAVVSINSNHDHTAHGTHADGDTTTLEGPVCANVSITATVHNMLSTPMRMNVTASVQGNQATLASATRHIGLRKVTSVRDANGYRLFYVNDRKFMVYGGGYSPHLFLRYNTSYQRAMLEKVKQMGLNTIRLEGKMMTAEFFEMTDEMGIMVLPGWCCCDAWQHWSDWKDEQHLIAMESMRSQFRRLRAHASVLGFLYGSDEAPPSHVENEYLRVREDEYWHLPFISSASNVSTPAGGRTGVKMNGPYAWVPPLYWYQGLAHVSSGAAFGFSTEISPGAAPVRLRSAKKMFEANELWPINDVWDFHCGSQLGLFHDLRFFVPPLTARVGAANSIEEFLFKSQLMTYEAERAMFDAYSTFKYRNSTGVVHWMLNNPFPSLIWHLIDFYGDGGGGFFGTRAALLPSTHAVFNPSSGAISVVRNDVVQGSSLLDLHVQIWSTGSELLWNDSVRIGSIGADDALLDVTNIQTHLSHFCAAQPRRTLLIHLLVKNQDNVTEDDQTYWHPCRPDVLDWSNSTFYITYCSQFANFSDLCNIEPAQLDIHLVDAVHVQVTNPRHTIAFFVEFDVIDEESGVSVDGYAFNDNYITLHPGATRTLTLNQAIEGDVKVAYKDLSSSHCTREPTTKM
ncbi:hypothetical protein PTSG_04518 [Salpingoeca rosetta]|uniref:Uncharacterized protein n=1 Tax=Salpingoeca rosetta (strain ATCC 50818 / BSB-021) TaxID=946362 RepID=F2U8T4_SALR5|nr:uncharacterized protein PTSG_04518 [Salpingoeca rosetta]EGD72792.1 hypothetical protein PTSG_04518 [Salpingoeca rosetta]|eukprot:XP_004994615.1 hypothetical protein PTSG_04518 [Salpingoeca rosetta]